MGKCFLYNQCNHVDCDDMFCSRRHKTHGLLKAACLEPAQFESFNLTIDADGTDLEEFKKLAQIKEHIGEFVEKGGNLYLYSNNCGNGKTSWSIKLLQAYIQTIWHEALPTSCRALFINVPRYLMALKDNISGKNEYATYIQNNIETADLIVWDDIAAKVGSEYELNQLLSRMEVRFSAKKANIFTSNTNTTDLKVALGERLASRIAGSSLKIELHGADKRFLSIIKWEEN